MEEAMADRSAKLRAFFAAYVADRGGASDPRIAAAFAAVPREPFAGPPPWFVLAVGPWTAGRTSPRYLRTPDGDPAFLYQDVLVALDAERGINIGEPSLHAHCLDVLALQPGECVLQVGAGSGYYTAILSQLVGPDGHVHAFEIDRTLAERAMQNLDGLPGVTVHARSGIAEDLPRVDVIYVNAGSAHPNRAWLDALHPGGRLLFPMQPESGLGAMLLLRRPTDDAAIWSARFVGRARFIGCQGGSDAAIDRDLAKAFRGDGARTVRSLRFDEPVDDTCWVRGRGWWLSTAPAG